MNHGYAIKLLRSALAPFAVAGILAAAMLSAGSPARADVATDIQNKINQRAAEIEALKKEIAAYQEEINRLGSEEMTLTAAIKTLTLTEKKLKADIAVTEDRIETTNLRLQQLSADIGETEGNIGRDTRSALAAFKSMHQESGRSVAEIILSSQTVSGAWDSVNSLALLESGLQKNISDLKASKTRLETNKKSTESAKADLVKYRAQLRDQQKAVLATQSEKNALLKQTRNSEAGYRALMAEKLALQEAFQREISEYESQLRLAVDGSRLPRSGSGVLSWPLDRIIITQYFGNTPFATANPQVYNGQGHGGIDLGVSIGTPVKTALSGTVIGVADTDLVRNCYSYGKWIMVRHDNGLSTLYAHLSVQSVSYGERVTTGQVIGYSGNTGYSTGPHLHFAVYATDGTEIKLFENSRNCKGATVPLAVQSAYLNPLSYLQALGR